MRRLLPLVFLSALTLGAVAIQFLALPAAKVATAPHENTVENTALNPDGSPASPSAGLGGSSAMTDKAKPAQPILPPLPEVNVGTHIAHAPPPEPVFHVEQNAHLPPVPHLNSGYGYGSPGMAGESGVRHQTASNQFSGTAQVTGPTDLTVGAVPVRLFGVRSPFPDDRCGDYHCVNVAVVALKGRLSRNATVFCRAASSGSSAAICLDAIGADLGGYLVGEGLARADAAQSNDYVGAEKIARDLRRGLWKR